MQNQKVRAKPFKMGVFITIWGGKKGEGFFPPKNWRGFGFDLGF